MKKNKLAKSSLAVGLTTLIITAGLSFSANGASDPVAQASSNAVRGTGLFSVLDGGQCDAAVPAVDPGRCGAGLSIPGISSYSQTATANADGTSQAAASVAPIDVLDLHTTLNLTDVVNGLAAIDTGSILDPIVGGVGGLLKTAIDALKLLNIDVVGAIDDALQALLTNVDNQLPISLRIGAVDASASAEPGAASGTSSIVDGLDLLVELPNDQVAEVPITAGTAPNSDLVITSPQDLVDGIIAGLVKSLSESLGGSLDGLSTLVAELASQILDPLFEQLEPTLLTNVSNLLAPVISGVVNQQDPVSPSDGELEVTALHLVVLGTNTLDLARVHVGPNAGPAADDNDAQADNDNDAQADVDNDAQADVDTQADVDNDAQADTETDADNDAAADADAAADQDADADADADVTRTLPDTGAPNLAPLWIMAMAFILFGGAILVNEKRRQLLS